MFPTLIALIDELKQWPQVLACKGVQAVVKRLLANAAELTDNVRENESSRNVHTNRL